MPDPDDSLFEFRRYRKTQMAEMRPYREGEDVTHISISMVDKASGSPKKGDMIARNPINHNDQWLVEEMFFLNNYELY